MSFIVVGPPVCGTYKVLGRRSAHGDGSRSPVVTQ